MPKHFAQNNTPEFDTSSDDDLHGESTAQRYGNGAAARQWSSNGSAAQQWDEAETRRLNVAEARQLDEAGTRQLDETALLDREQKTAVWPIAQRNAATAAENSSAAATYGAPANGGPAYADAWADDTQEHSRGTFAIIAATVVVIAFLGGLAWFVLSSGLLTGTEASQSAVATTTTAAGPDATPSTDGSSSEEAVATSGEATGNGSTSGDNASSSDAAASASTGSANASSNASPIDNDVDSNDGSSSSDQGNSSQGSTSSGSSDSSQTSGGNASDAPDNDVVVE